MESKEPKQEVVAWRWYEQLVALPGFLVLFAFSLILLIFFFIVKRDLRKEPSFKSISADLFPYISALSLIFFAILIDHPKILMGLAWLSGFCILELASRTVRFAYDPLGFLDPYLFQMLKSKNSLAGDFAAQTFKKYSEEERAVDREKKTSLISTEVTIMVVTIAKTILAKSKSPRGPLIFFVGHFACSTVLTIGLFAILLKYSTIEIQRVPSIDYFVASLLRFTSGATLNEIFRAPINVYLLAFESAVGFLYLVIAIMAFGATASYSADQLRERLGVIYDREMKDLKEKSLEMFEKEIESNNKTDVPR